MTHVDALSRSPVESSGGYDEVQMLQVVINDYDWVLVAQLSDDKYRGLHLFFGTSSQNAARLTSSKTFCSQ